MKKLLALVLAVAMLASMATIVSAAESSTTLTVIVQPAEYTLLIPESQTIQYGEDCRIGNVTTIGSSSFAVGKNLQVTVEYDGLFKSESVATTIPYTLMLSPIPAEGSSVYKDLEFPSGNTLTFKGRTDGTLAEKARETFKTVREDGLPGESYVEDLVLCVDAENWGKALAGTYTTTIIFTSEVVAEVAGA